jgi:hypothetical protein
MESDHLTSPRNEDRKIATLLREQAPPLPPRVFSAQVLAALPPRPTGSRSLRRMLLCGLGAALGFAFAWKQMGVELSPDGLRHVAQAFADPRMLASLAITGASVLFAFWRGPRTPHRQ